MEKFMFWSSFIGKLMFLVKNGSFCWKNESFGAGFGCFFVEKWEFVMEKWEFWSSFGWKTGVTYRPPLRSVRQIDPFSMLTTLIGITITQTDLPSVCWQNWLRSLMIHGQSGLSQRTLWLISFFVFQKNGNLCSNPEDESTQWMCFPPFVQVDDDRREQWTCCCVRLISSCPESITETVRRKL